MRMKLRVLQNRLGLESKSRASRHAPFENALQRWVSLDLCRALASENSRALGQGSSFLCSFTVGAPYFAYTT